MNGRTSEKCVMPDCRSHATCFAVREGEPTPVPVCETHCDGLKGPGVKIVPLAEGKNYDKPPEPA